MVINVAVIENVVGVPLRRVFRYAQGRALPPQFIFSLFHLYISCLQGVDMLHNSSKSLQAIDQLLGCTVTLKAR
jgi:hypothetical protein